jgi:AcrR family transcriptional regulator
MTAESRIGKRRKAANDVGRDAYREKRAEIIAAAAAVFQEKGYSASTLSDVARRMGTDRATLYYYVSSKEELLEEVVRPAIAQNLANLEEIEKSSATAREKICAVVEQAMISYEANYPFMYVYIQEDLARGPLRDTEWGRAAIRQGHRADVIVRRIIEAGKVEGIFRADLPASVTTSALTGMTVWTHRWFRPDGVYSAKEVADVFCALLLKGLEIRDES